MSGKKYSDASERLDRQQLHDPVDAVGLVKELASANFDEAVDIFGEYDEGRVVDLDEGIEKHENPLKNFSFSIIDSLFP